MGGISLSVVPTTSKWDALHVTQIVRRFKNLRPSHTAEHIPGK
jgi:hypothetical protein